MLDLLSSLISKSLVMADSECAGGRRYRLLETVRQYARERLVQGSAAERLRERHFEFFFNEFRGALPVLSHHGQLPCLRRLRIEQENIRAALDWALKVYCAGGAGRGARGRALLVLDEVRPIRGGHTLARISASEVLRMCRNWCVRGHSSGWRTSIGSKDVTSTWTQEQPRHSYWAGNWVMTG